MTKAWTQIKYGDESTYPKPGKRIVIAVRTKYRDELGRQFIYEPWAIRTAPEFFEILGTGGREIHISKVISWRVDDRLTPYTERQYGRKGKEEES